MAEFFEAVKKIVQERDAQNTTPSVSAAIGAMNQPPRAPTTTDPRPAALGPNQVQITPPAEQVDKTWITSLVQGVFSMSKKVPIVNFVANGVDEFIGDLQAAAAGQSKEEREEEKKAKRKAERLAKLKATIDVDEESPNPEEKQEVDPEAALKALIEEAQEEHEDEDDRPADDPEERPAKKARLSSPPMDRMFGPVKLAHYLYIARAMDASKNDKNAPKDWTGNLEIIYPGKGVNQTTIDKAVKLHGQTWGFPAYLMCIEMPHSTAAGVITGYTRWLTNHLKVDLDAWDCKSEPPGLDAMLNDGA